MHNQLPDTPWHVGYAKKKELDPRRHKFRCVNYDEGLCRNPRSKCFLTSCGGSSHCSFYVENLEDFEKNLVDNVTQEEIDANSRMEYLEHLREKKKKTSSVTRFKEI